MEVLEGNATATEGHHQPPLPLARASQAPTSCAKPLSSRVRQARRGRGAEILTTGLSHFHSHFLCRNSVQFPSSSPSDAHSYPIFHHLDRQPRPPIRPTDRLRDPTRPNEARCPVSRPRPLPSHALRTCSTKWGSRRETPNARRRRQPLVALFVHIDVAPARSAQGARRPPHTASVGSRASQGDSGIFLFAGRLWQTCAGRISFWAVCDLHRNAPKTLHCVSAVHAVQLDTAAPTVCCWPGVHQQTLQRPEGGQPRDESGRLRRHTEYLRRTIPPSTTTTTVPDAQHQPRIEP